MSEATLPEGYDLNMDEVVDHLHGLGVSAYVEQTGGGCATIYAGPTQQGSDFPRTPAVTYAAVAGPGSYGWGQRPSAAMLGDFYIGADDMGETEPVDAGLVGARSAEDVARLIAEQVRHPERPSTREEVRALGFDAEARRVEDVAEELRDQVVRVTADLGAPLGVCSTEGELVAVARLSWNAPGAPLPLAILQQPDGSHVAVGLTRGTVVESARTAVSS